MTNSRTVEGGVAPYSGKWVPGLGDNNIWNSRWHNISNSDLSGTASTSAPTFAPPRLGSIYKTDWGTFVYCKAGEAIAKGSAVMVPTTFLTLGAVGGTSYDVCITPSDSRGVPIMNQVYYATGGLTVDAWAGGWLWVDDSTDTAEEYQCGRILSNTANTFILEDDLTTVLNAADTDVTVFASPFNGIVKTSATNPELQMTIGVASVGAFTNAYFGWVQVSGFCPYALIDNAGTNILAGDPLLCSNGTAGELEEAAWGAANIIVGIAMTDEREDSKTHPVWLLNPLQIGV